MDVILMQDVENLGQMGQTLSVNRGYARNYLLPQGFALEATAGNMNVVQEHMKLEHKRDGLRKTSAEERARELGEISCTITVQADDDGKLFGSVTARNIVEELAKENIQLEHKQIVLDEPIRLLGVHSVPVRLHSEVEVMAKVWVVKA